VLFAIAGTADRTGDAYVNMLFVGGMSGLAAAALVAWALAGVVGNVFRRAMVAMVALGGATFVGAVTMPAHAAGGRAGLGILAGLCIGVMALAYRRAILR
jgi:hypothetical protein